MKPAVAILAAFAAVVIAAVAAETIRAEIRYRCFWDRRGAWWL